MKSVVIDITKQDVYEEVAKTTAYTGARMQGDDGAYDRIFTKDSDMEMLERFWSEACSAATEQLKNFVTEVSGEAAGSAAYHLKLELSSSYDDSLTAGMKASLTSYLVLMIVSRWSRITNRTDSESYATDAAGAMDDVMKKVYYRKKPTRTKPTWLPTQLQGELVVTKPDGTIEIQRPVGGAIGSDKLDAIIQH